MRQESEEAGENDICSLWRMVSVNLFFANRRKGIKDESRFNEFWGYQGANCLVNFLKEESSIGYEESLETANSIVVKAT